MPLDLLSRLGGVIFKRSFTSGKSWLPELAEGQFQSAECVARFDKYAAEEAIFR